MDNIESSPEQDKQKDTELSQAKDNIVNDNLTQTWQRLAPIAMCYFFVKLLYVFFSNLFFLIPAVIFGYKHIINNPWIWLPALLGVVIFIGLIVFLNFYFFQYRLVNEHIEIRSGVFSKKHINLPFTRIQNVKLVQPIYYRPFGYTCLELDTAGSAQQEAKIVALKLSFAEALKKEILTTHDQNDIQPTEINVEQSNEQIVENDTQDETILNTRSLKDLIIHGITNNRVWIFLGGLAPFLDDIGRYVDNFFQNLGIDIEQLLTFADKSWWQISLWALTLTLLILLPIVLFSIIGSIITFYNYTLSKIGDRYIRRSGLLTKHEVTMKLPRLQMVYRQQDWLDILLNRINLTFEQNNVIGQNVQPGGLNNKIMVPSITADECQTLINDVFPDNTMETLIYTRISKRFLLRNIGYILTPLFIVLSVFAATTGKFTLLNYLVPAYLILSGLVFCRWYRWGYAQDKYFLYVRKGVLGVDYCCFPIYKVQQTKFIQSVFMKRHQLCSLSIVLASGAVNIPYINEQQGYNMTNELLYQVEESRRSWM